MSILGGINAATTSGQPVENAHISRNNIHVMDAFSPSSYAASVDATTSPTTQAVALVAGVKLGVGRIRAVCRSTGETVLVAFGESSAAAISNVPDGMPVFYGQPDLLKVPDLATWVAYQGATATSSFHLTQGV